MGTLTHGQIMIQLGHVLEHMDLDFEWHGRFARIVDDRLPKRKPLLAPSCGRF
jgi:hypothetical protein